MLETKISSSWKMKKKKKQEKKNSFSHEYAIEMINVSISFKCNHIVHVLLIC